ncbi:hypothetical protein HRG_015003 [Hirsutella rhossiliensis]
MSSPSRENLRVLAKVNTESIAMASHSQGIVSDKNSRTQAYANRMKRGKIVRPRGEFITSSSMADITREYEELQAKQTRLQTRQEIRMHLKRVRGEMQKIREDYKVGKKQLVNGRVKTLNFKPWLEFTGRDVEFYTLEQSCDTLMRELKEPSKESFSMIPRREITPPEMSGRAQRPDLAHLQICRRCPAVTIPSISQASILTNIQTLQEHRYG